MADDLIRLDETTRAAVASGGSSTWPPSTRTAPHR